MTVKVTAPALNLREKLSELDKPSGIAGQDILKADTPQEVFNYIGAGRRNLIINGAMQVAQRGTSFSNPTGAYTLDRFEFANSSLGAWDVTQATDAPKGFKYSLKATCTTADASPASGDYCFIRYSLETQDVEHLNMGTSDALELTASFWVKSNKTGTFGIETQMRSTVTIERSADITINSADTWEYKTITIPANTSYAPTSGDNEQGFSFWFWINGGSTFKGTPNSSWADQPSGRGGTLTAGIGGAVNDYFAITGVQLEVGSVATPFEHRSYGEELALCHRYYYQIGSSTTALNRFGIMGEATAATSAQYNFLFPTPMRSNPSLIYNANGGTTYVYSGNVGYTSTSIGLGNTLFGEGGEAVAARFYMGGFSSLPAGNACQAYNATVGSTLAFDAEL